MPLYNQLRILALKQVRTLHNQVNKGPDLQGRKQALKRSDTSAIADYLNNDSILPDDKGKPWTDIAEAAGIVLPQTYYFKALGYYTIKPEAIQLAYRDDEKIINTVCKEEKLLTKAQANYCLDWINKQLSL